jgi:hypothetical protein
VTAIHEHDIGRSSRKKTSNMDRCSSPSSPTLFFFVDFEASRRNGEATHWRVVSLSTFTRQRNSSEQSIKPIIPKPAFKDF